VAALGTATTPVHVTKLLKLADELVFSFDGDAAGRKAAWRALEVSLPLLVDHKPVRFLFLPEGDDPDTFVRKHGKDAFEKQVGAAKTLSEFLIDELRQGSDLNSNEGRAKFLSAAKPYLQKMGGSQLPNLVAREVATLARQPDEAPSLLARAPATQFSRPAPYRPNTARQFELEKRVLTLVFAKPAFALEVDLQFLGPEHEETAALAEIRGVVAKNEDPDSLSDAMLIELTQASAHRDLIAQAQAVWLSLKLTPEEALGELRDAMTKLRTRIPQDEKHLSTKVLKGIATPEERRAYEQRLADKRTQ
jgi:DNA primase